MILPDRLAEVIEDLRHLAACPTLEGATQLLEDWAERQELYDTTPSGWSRNPTEGDPHV